jgi:pimeloyl-ACP methyl ester carboxylesterase
MSSRCLFLAAGLAVGALCVAVGIKGYLVFDTSRATQRPPVGQRSVPVKLSQTYALEAVTYSVGGDVKVAGWYIPSRQGAAIVFVHGQPGTRDDLLPEAEAVAAAGYGALLIDLPGHGESTGTATWGKSARKAVVRGLDYLARRCDVSKARLGVFGFSYGSSLVAHVAALDRRIRALVLAGSFTSARAQIEYAYGSFGPLSIAPAIWGATWDGLELDDLRTRDVVPSVAPTPILFLAGSADIVVPARMTRDVFEHAREPKEYLSIEGAGHGNYGDVAGRRYFEQVVAFFDQHLAPGASEQQRGRANADPACIEPGPRLRAR